MDGTPIRPGTWRSAEEWGAILNKALPDFCCRACGGKKWYTPASDESSIGALHYVSWPDGSVRSSLISVPFVCQDCGLIELFGENELVRRAGQQDG